MSTLCVLLGNLYIETKEDRIYTILVMSGHSKWSTIKRQKGAADIRRSQTFTKVANAITLAAKLGGSGDANANPRLRTILEEAKSVNMPKDNIQRAIDRGLGNLPGQTIEELTYEGFGPGKVAFLVEGLTDNRLRTNQEIKYLFDRNGGNLGGPGSVSYLFDKKGEIKVRGNQARNKDDEILELMDTGAEDIEDYEEDQKKFYLIYTSSTTLNEVAKKVIDLGYTIESQEIIFKPNILAEINDKETAQKVLEFAEKLEEHDDVQKVFANFDIPDNLLE